MVAGMLDISRGEIYWAGQLWLFAVAAVLFPAGYSGGSGNHDIPSDMQSGGLNGCC